MKRSRRTSFLFWDAKRFLDEFLVGLFETLASGAGCQHATLEGLVCKSYGWDKCGRLFYFLLSLLELYLVIIKRFDDIVFLLLQWDKNGVASISALSEKTTKSLKERVCRSSCGSRLSRLRRYCCLVEGRQKRVKRGWRQHQQCAVLDEGTAAT